MGNNYGDSNITDMNIKSVYSSLHSVLRVLNNEAYHSIPEVNELLSLWESCKPVTDTKSERNIFVVLEGLDGSGKSTVSKILAKNLNAVQTSTPPPIVSQLRTKFDEHPEELRRAYYSLGNYFIAEEIKRILLNQPVVMDRFWNSTAAYGIANEVSKLGNSSLPAEDDAIYKWPEDLLKPDFIFFLNISEEARNERLSWRKSITVEEQKLKNESTYRKLLMEAYTRMKDNSFVMIDSNMPLKEVVEHIRNVLISSGRVNDDTFKKEIIL